MDKQIDIWFLTPAVNHGGYIRAKRVPGILHHYDCSNSSSSCYCVRVPGILDHYDYSSNRCYCVRVPGILHHYDSSSSCYCVRVPWTVPSPLRLQQQQFWLCKSTRDTSPLRLQQQLLLCESTRDTSPLRLQQQQLLLCKSTRDSSVATTTAAATAAVIV